MASTVVACSCAGNLCAMAQRGARHEAHLALARVVVQLVDHAVDVVRQAVAPGADVLEIGDQPVEAARSGDFGRDRKTPFPQLPQRGRMRRRQFAAVHDAHRIGEEAQLALRSDRRVQLAQRTGGTVAGIGQGLLAMRAGPFVEGLEIPAQHDDFAAHFQHLRPAAATQLQRDRADRAHVGGHVLAGLAVAARGALHEHAMLVAQADRQAIELGLGGKQRVAAVQRLLDAPHELGHFAETVAIIVRLAFGHRLFEGIAQRQHRQRMAHFGEAAGGAGTDAAGRRIRHGQVRMRGFQCLQLAHHAIVIGVGNLRVVEHVVAVVGLLDPRAQLGCMRPDILGGDGLFAHAWSLEPVQNLSARMHGRPAVAGDALVSVYARAGTPPACMLLQVTRTLRWIRGWLGQKQALGDRGVACVPAGTHPARHAAPQPGQRWYSPADSGW